MDICDISRLEFAENIRSAWQELQLESDFCDVTLACADNQIQVHKVIISASSPVLKNILKLNSNKNPIIYLKGVQYSDLQNIVTFIYQGRVNVAQEDLESFLVIAKDLEIKGLCENDTNLTDQSNIENEDGSTLDDIMESIDAFNDSIVVKANEEILKGNIFKKQTDIDDIGTDSNPSSEIKIESQELSKIVTFSKITGESKDINEKKMLTKV